MRRPPSPFITTLDLGGLPKEEDLKIMRIPPADWSFASLSAPVKVT